MLATGVAVALTSTLACAPDAEPGTAGDAHEVHVLGASAQIPPTRPNPNRRLVLRPSVVGKLPPGVSAVDHSGTVEIQIMACRNTQPSQHMRIRCDLDPDFVAVGGGAAMVGTTSHEGALLVESRPFDNDLGSWLGASKDHLVGDRHILEVHVVGLRLAGVSRAALHQRMVVASGVSALEAHPRLVTLNGAGFTTIGGGASLVNSFFCGGNLLTASSPTSHGWFGAGKDHGMACPARIEVFAIGIDPNDIPGFGGSLEIGIKSFSVPTFPGDRGGPVFPLDPAQHVTTGGLGGTVQLEADDGWVSASVGALNTWNGAGRLLSGILNNGKFAAAMDKDHVFPAGGTLFGLVTQVRRRP